MAPSWQTRRRFRRCSSDQRRRRGANTGRATSSAAGFGAAGIIRAERQTAGCGHAAIATYERIRSRRGVRHQMDVAKLLPLTYAVVLVLGFLMLTTLLLDIVRPIS